MIAELGAATGADTVVVWRKWQFIESANWALVVHCFASSLK
jgi:hypothetical protein